MGNFDKKYKEALRKATKIHRDDDEKIKHYMEVLFPELKDEDERIRKALIKFFNRGAENGAQTNGVCDKDIIAWLEKQVSIDENEVAKRVLIEVSDSIMRWLDANCAEGNMCLSNMECEDIENAVRNANWQKIYGYMKKKLEKQGGQKPQGKSALEAIKEEKVDNANKIEPKDYSSIDPYFGKPIDNVEPKFKLGDKIRIKNPSSWDKDMEVARIEKDYYICNHIGKFSSEVVPFSKESDYELIEHKSANKVEPKFHRGEWVIHQGTKNIYQVVSVINNQYRLKYGDNYTVQNCADVDRCARLWDITKDAKDGDVLTSELCDSIILFRGIKDDNIDFYCDYDISKIDIPVDRFSVNNGQHYGNVEDSKDFHPATKEQRDTLFAKIKEAGYEWSDKKKKLKKIEQKSTEWGEEDDYNLQCMLAKVTSDIQKGIGSRNNVLIDWLKSLKNRIK